MHTGRIRGNECSRSHELDAGLKPCSAAIVEKAGRAHWAALRGRWELPSKSCPSSVSVELALYTLWYKCGKSVPGI